MSRQITTPHFHKSKTLDNKYMLGDEIGKGAYGQVYKGLDLENGNFVAIKQVSLENIAQEDLNIIMQEIDLLKNLNHKNIVKYLGSLKTRSHLHIILEYVENGSLANIIKPNKFGPFPEQLVAHYIAQVLEGLVYLHEQGVIHRDIKGANILTTKEGLVKLADFRVATKLTEADVNTHSVVGTPYWMAPEVIEMSGVCAASDIWSVGCTVIELLTCVPPYYDLQPMPALFRIVQDENPPIPDGLSADMSDFLRLCFKKDARQRPDAKMLLSHPWIQNYWRTLQPPLPSSDADRNTQEDAVMVAQISNEHEIGMVENHALDGYPPMHKYEEGAKKRKRQQTESFDRCYHWDELPNGPLIEIARRLSNFDDLQVMYLVCTRWNSVLRESRCKFLDGGRAGCCSPQVPWLMMAEQESVENDKLWDKSSSKLCLRPCSSKGKAMRLYIYSLSFQRVRELVTRLPPELELAIKEDNFSNCCLFSSHGWILVVRTRSTMCLYNPFCSPSSHNYIPLPGLDTLSSCVSRFTLSACPCTKSYTVMIVYDTNKIGLWKPGDKVWTLVDHSPLCGVFVLDVIFYRGYYYVLDQLKHIFRLSGSGSDELKWERLPSLFDGINDGSGHRYLWKAYFVVGDEEKLLVAVRLCLYPKTQPLFELPHDYLTAGFRVVEIVVSPKRFDNRVKDVNSLGTTSLFVGRNQAFAIDVPKAYNPSASGYYGCKPNCIYYTDDRLYILPTAKFGKGKDMGVYNMEDGSVDRHFQGLSLQGHSPMLWVEPHS